MSKAGGGRQARAKPVFVDEPSVDGAASPSGAPSGVSWSFPNDGAAGASSPIIGAATEKSFSSVHEKSTMGHSMRSGGGMVGGTSTVLLSSLTPEEHARRRAVELDDRRQKEWIEFARLNRHDGQPVPKVFLDITIGSSSSGSGIGGGGGNISMGNASVNYSAASQRHAAHSAEQQQQQGAVSDDVSGISAGTGAGGGGGGSGSTWRIVIELLADVLPKTCENFRELCLGHGGWSAECGGVKLDYADTRCTRIVPGVGAFFGDLGGLSLAANGHTIPDESFALRHSARGVVSMVSDAGPNRIGSKFVICFDRAPQLDFKYVPFARVVDGFNVLDKLEQQVPRTAVTCIPTVPVTISMCGALNGKKPQLVTPPAGTPLWSNGGGSAAAAAAAPGKAAASAADNNDDAGEDE